MNDASTLAETLRKFRIVDLSQALEEHMPNFPTHSKFHHNLWGSYRHGDRALTYQLVLNEHNGTHVDAPAHFISDAKPQDHVTIEQVPLGRLMGRGAHLDCRQFHDGDYVPRSFVIQWEAEHGAIQAGDIVLFDFGWAALGVDTLSPDPPEALRTTPIHPVVLEKQVLIIENLCNLGQLPDFFLFLALPLKIR